MCADHQLYIVKLLDTLREYQVILPLNLVTLTGFLKTKFEYYSKYDIEIWLIF